jgi:sulfoxide reductase heme-binding subunit YedZ
MSVKSLDAATVRPSKATRNTFYKFILFLICLLPMVQLFTGAMMNSLGVNPVETIIRTTGDWTLYFLLITLSVTPVRQLLGFKSLIRYRRMLGLYSFFYACMHFLSYIWFDQFFDVAEILKDIVKRPFITLGFISLLLMSLLAITSTNKMMQRLKRNWKRVHQLIYPIAMMGVLHFFMMTKADYKQPLILATILVILLGYRLLFFRIKQ